MLQPAEVNEHTIFQTMADDAPVMIWITDPTGYCTYLNKQWLEFTGQTLEEGKGLGWTTAVHPDDSAEVGRVFMECSAQQKPFNFDYRIRHKSGNYRWAVDTGKPRYDAAGNFLGFIGTVIEITERKQAEEKLQINEARLRMAVESTGLGTFDFYPETGELVWDARCKQLFGLPSDADVDYAVFLAGLHPLDKERVHQLVQQSMQPESDGVFNAEYRTVDMITQEVRWISARGRAYFNASGSVHRFVGTVLDITQRKLIEEELKSSEERLREALMVASTGTWKINLETGIDTRDASLNQILGLEPVETHIPFADSLIRVHPDDKLRMKEALEKAIQSKSFYDEELRIFQPDGKMIWVRDRGQVVLDEKGEPSYVIGAAIDITHQKHKEEALKISEEQFRELFDHASVGMAVVSLNGTFLQVNPVYEKLFGYSRDELLTRDVASLTHPSFIQSTQTKMQQCILGEIDRYTEEKKYIRQNGEEFWAHVSVSIVKDLTDQPKNFVGIVSNIHEKKVAEESLKLQAQVLKSMDEGVSVWDADGCILYTNAAEDKMFGYEAGELLGQPVSIQSAPSPTDNRVTLETVMQQLKTKGYWNGEWYNQRKNGDTFYTYSHITYLDLGERQVIVNVQRDITEEKKYKEALQRSAEELEKRVEERTAELQEANQQLERSNAELEQFAYITSHDLQEPLRKIKTFASRIQDELTDSGNEKALKHLEKVSGSANRMSVLIRDLLDYSRLTKEERSFETVDLNEIVRDVLSDLEVLVSQKKAVVYAEGLPVIKGIRLQLNQLFFNLIGNSLKFTKPDVPPEISVQAEKLSPPEAGKYGLKPCFFYRIVFKDNGIGFNPSYKEQIFEIFQRLNARETYAGTGIGLALSKRVVENHFGTITAASEEGKGATFTVCLPVERPDASHCEG